LRYGCEFPQSIHPPSQTFQLTTLSHVKVFTGELNGFLWLCIAIWSFDRLLRLARVIYHGLIPRFAKGEKATATYDPSADIIRLDVTALLPDKIMKPGEYYYLYASSGIRSYQSHPFTLCSWQTRATTTTVQPSPSPTTAEDAKTPNPTTLSTSPSPSTSTTTCTTNHTLLIRPHNGFTASLKSRLSPSPKDITILLEGPYGHSVDLRPFTDVLFLVGGSGITAAISHLTVMLLQSSQRKKMSIHLLWAVPNARVVENVCENELAAVMREPGFRMTVYETRGLDSPGSSELEKNGDGKEVSRGGSPPAPAYTLLQGRPDLSSAIRDARQNCVGRSLAVVSCGPPRLADACRRGVVEDVGDGEGTGTGVEFFNEAMAW
jgi:predicted ferric reductase